MAAFGNIRPQTAQAAQQGTVDPQRPWLMTPTARPESITTGLGFFKPSGTPKPVFMPMGTAELIKLSAEQQGAYFADYAKYGNSLSGLRLMAGPGGGFMGLSVAKPGLAGLEQQRQALNDLLYPRAPGGFLPRAIQPQRTPNAPGAR
jgi:hypothetical protein